MDRRRRMKYAEQKFTRDLCVKVCPRFNKILQACLPLYDDQCPYFLVRKRNGRAYDLLVRLQLLSGGERKELRFSHVGEGLSDLRLEQDNNGKDDLRPEALDKPIYRKKFKITRRE